MAAKIGIAVLVLLAVLGVVIALQPAHFRVERSAVVAAPPAAVFEQVNDFHHWPKWSPWEKLDPGMKKTFSGAPAGTGAEYAWAGNDKAGEGKMRITHSQPTERIDIQLDFIKPFAATNQATFTFSPSGAGTQVKWTMDGNNGFISKAFCLFVDMDSMVGKDFDQGLANLNTAAKTP